MAEPIKIVKGGFRATLALIISVFALILSVLAFTSSGREDFQAAIEKVKAESAEQMEKLRNETARTLERLGKTIKKEQQEPGERPE